MVAAKHHIRAVKLARFNKLLARLEERAGFMDVVECEEPGRVGEIVELLEAVEVALLDIEVRLRRLERQAGISEPPLEL